LIRRSTRPVVKFSTATCPPACTITARVRVTARSSGRPATRYDRSNVAPAASITSTAPLRAAYTRAPSEDASSASGSPGSETAPPLMPLSRSTQVTVVPAAT